MTSTTITETSGATITFRHRPAVNLSLHDGVAWATCSLCGRGCAAVQFGGATHAKRCDLRGVAGIETV